SPTEVPLLPLQSSQPSWGSRHPPEDQGDVLCCGAEDAARAMQPSGSCACHWQAPGTKFSSWWMGERNQNVSEFVSINRAILRLGQKDQPNKRRGRGDHYWIPKVSENIAVVDHQCGRGEGKKAAHDPDAQMVGKGMGGRADSRWKHLYHEGGLRPVHHSDES